MEIYGDDGSSDRDPDHHCRQTHTPAAVDAEPFAGLESASVDYGAKGGDQPAAQGGGMYRLETIGKTDEIHIGVVDGDQLGKRPPGTEAGREGPVAGVEMSSPARPTHAAADREGDRHPISHLPSLHPGAHDIDHTCHFVAGYVGKSGEILVPHPGVPVAKTHPAGLDAENDTMLGNCRVIHLGDYEGLLKLGDQCGTQDLSLRTSSSPPMCIKNVWASPLCWVRCGANPLDRQ